MNQISLENFKINKNNWKKVKLGDVVFEPKESVKDPVAEGIKHVVGLEHIDSENIHLIRSASIDESTTFSKTFRLGDVLFGRRRAYLKKAARAEFDGICSGDITVMRTKNGLLTELLPFIINNDKFFDYAITHSAGGLSPRVKFHDLADFELQLPNEEQQVELSNLFGAIDNLLESERQVLENLQSASQKVFEQLVNVSEGYEIELSKVLIPKKNKSSPPHKIEKYIGLEHVESGAFNCNSFGYSIDAIALCNVVEAGDLCYSKLRPYLDKAFIADFSSVATTELLVYKTVLASELYVLYHLHSNPFIDYVSSQGFGTKMPRVSHEIIGKYKIKVLKDEKKILESMKKFELSKQAAIEKINSTNLLLKSLINQLF